MVFLSFALLCFPSPYPTATCWLLYFIYSFLFSVLPHSFTFHSPTLFLFFFCCSICWRGKEGYVDVHTDVQIQVYVIKYVCKQKSVCFINQVDYAITVKLQKTLLQLQILSLLSLPMNYGGREEVDRTQVPDIKMPAVRIKNISAGVYQSEKTFPQQHQETPLDNITWSNKGEREPEF